MQSKWANDTKSVWQLLVTLCYFKIYISFQLFHSPIFFFSFSDSISFFRFIFTITFTLSPIKLNKKNPVEIVSSSLRVPHKNVNQTIHTIRTQFLPVFVFLFSLLSFVRSNMELCCPVQYFTTFNLCYNFYSISSTI